MDKVMIHEVGLRDGLQMEKQIVPTKKKLELLRMLISSGVDMIQLGSFVHPKRVPQMADTEDLFRQAVAPTVPSREVVLSGLVLNEKGLERGLSCGVEMFCMGVSASETHSRQNTGMTISEALDRILNMARLALAEGKRVQVSVQSAFGCGFEGAIAEDRVLRIINRYLEAGLSDISLADTAGHADPEMVKNRFERVMALADEIECSCHFHDNYGMALANCYAALEMGVRRFESSFGGLGGCPFTANPGGNVCTEDLVQMLQRMHRRHDIDLSPLVRCATETSRILGRQLPGSVYRSGPLPM